MKLELLGSYKLLESSVLTDDDRSVSFPGAQLKPYPKIDCGSYSFELGQPVPAKIKSFLAISQTGTVTLTPPKEDSAGFYIVNLTVALAEYPSISLATSVVINIQPCIPM